MRAWVACNRASHDRWSAIGPPRSLAPPGAEDRTFGRFLNSKMVQIFGGRSAGSVTGCEELRRLTIWEGHQCARSVNTRTVTKPTTNSTDSVIVRSAGFTIVQNRAMSCSHPAARRSDSCSSMGRSPCARFGALDGLQMLLRTRVPLGRFAHRASLLQTTYTGLSAVPSGGGRKSSYLRRPLTTLCRKCAGIWGIVREQRGPADPPPGPAGSMAKCASRRRGEASRSTSRAPCSPLRRFCITF
jgi:hypothetical protein